MCCLVNVCMFKYICMSVLCLLFWVLLLLLHCVVWFLIHQFDTSCWLTWQTSPYCWLTWQTSPCCWLTWQTSIYCWLIWLTSSYCWLTWQTSPHCWLTWQTSPLVDWLGKPHHAVFPQWVNGQQVMTHDGGHLPFEGQINSALNFNGVNRVTVAVNNTLLPTTLPPGSLEFKTNTKKSVQHVCSSTVSMVTCYGCLVGVNQLYSLSSSSFDFVYFWISQFLCWYWIQLGLSAFLFAFWFCLTMDTYTSILVLQLYWIQIASSNGYKCSDYKWHQF